VEVSDKRKTFAHAGIGTADHPTGSLVSVPSMLSVLPARLSTSIGTYLPKSFDDAANFVPLNAPKEMTMTETQYKCGQNVVKYWHKMWGNTDIKCGEILA
jgi:hypothetical protein